MILWHIKEPDYQDTKVSNLDEVINGEYEDDYGMPGAKCDACNDTHATFNVYPKPIPDKLLNKIKHASACMPIDEFTRFESEIKKELSELDLFVPDQLYSGTLFAPTTWKPKSPCIYHIYWNVFHVFISEKLKELIANENWTGCDFLNLSIDSTGVNYALDQRYLLEGIKHSTPRDNGTHEVQRNFCELVVFSHSYYVYEKELYALGEVCKKCNCEFFNRERTKAFEEKRNHYRTNSILPRRYALNQDIFNSHIYTGGFMLSDRVYQSLLSISPGNFQAKQVQVVD